MKPIDPFEEILGYQPRSPMVRGSGIMALFRSKAPPAPAAELPAPPIARSAIVMPGSEYLPPIPFDSIIFRTIIEKTGSEAAAKDFLRRHETMPDDMAKGYDMQVIGPVWTELRRKHGLSGDRRHPWERTLDISFADMVKEAQSSDTSSWPDTNQDALRAKERLAKILQNDIHQQANALKGRDAHSIRVWGDDINKERVNALKQTHGQSIRDINQRQEEIKTILKDYENLLRAKPPKGLKGVWARTVRAVEVISPFAGPDQDYRFYSHAEKMERGEEIIGQLEAFYTRQIEAQEERLVFAEETEGLAQDFQDITRYYTSALKKNLTRLLGEGAEHDTIYTRLAALERAEDACEREVLHYRASKGLYRETQARMREILDITIPAYQTQMRTAYLQALGQQALSTDAIADSLDSVMHDKKRAAELADNLEKLANRVRDLAGLQQAMSNNEKLVLEYNQPLALEYKTVLALPAPTDTSDADHHQHSTITQG